MRCNTTNVLETGLVDNLRPREAARYLGLSESTLAKLRMRGSKNVGPNYVKLGRSVIYRRSDLKLWLEQNVIYD